MAVAAVTRFRPGVSYAAVGGVSRELPPIAGNHPKMEIVPEGGTPFIVPYAPRETTVDGIAPNWAEVDRGGRAPLLLRAGDSLATMAMELVVAYPDWNQSIEPVLAQLRALAGSGQRMRVRLDPTSGAYQWRITRFSQQTLARQHGTNDPTRAMVSLTFTATSDPVQAVGPLTGGANAGGGGGGGGGGKGPKSKPSFYVVKKGDTLQSIANDYYGFSSAWRDIADENKIKDPKSIKVGDKLRMPTSVKSHGGVLTA